eukprot:COSAG01_NODE_12280_length_1767_cov_1.169065_2_plen_371_part_01
MVELRSVESGDLLHVVPDLGEEAFVARGEAHVLSFSPRLLAIGGKNRSDYERKVRLLWIGDGGDFGTVAATLSLPSLFCRLSFDPAGARLAVGLVNSTDVLVFSIDNSNPADFGPPLTLVAQRPGGNRTKSVAFSPDGHLLCVGCDTNTFTLWGTGASDPSYLICQRVIDHEDSGGCVCAFSPMGNLLVTGGLDSELVVRELSPTAPAETYTLPSESDAESVSQACVSGEFCALAARNQLTVIKRVDGQPVWQAHHLEGSIDPSPLDGSGMLAIQPHQEEQLAVAITLDQLMSKAERASPRTPRRQGSRPNVQITGTKIVSLRCISTGHEQHRLGPFRGWFGGLKYTPDGSLLCIFGALGLATFATETGHS